MKNLDKVLVSGGGAYNDYLIHLIRSKTDSEIIISSKNIIEFKEALIFAFLGVLRNLNINNTKLANLIDLQDPVRTGVIFKEIFDKPKSLRGRAR